MMFTARARESPARTVAAGFCINSRAFIAAPCPHRGTARSPEAAFLDMPRRA
jgi:hypothetical protein